MAFVVVVVTVSLLIGLSKGGMGAALVVLVTPLLSLVMPASQSVSLALPLLMIADAFAIWMYWKQWDMQYIRVMLPMSILGIAIGTYFLATLPDEAIRLIIGVLTLLFIVYKLVDERLNRVQYHRQAWHGYLAGGASGLASALANTGAVPFTAYMLLQDLRPEVFVGTTTLFFALVNALKVPGYVITGLLDLEGVLKLAWAIPLIPVGVWLGRWMVRHMNKWAFERFMLLVLFIAALVLLFVPPR